MDKITLLKDINGNLVYPKILSESIPDKAINKTLLNSDVTSIFDGLISREFLSRSGESAQNAFETGIYSWCTSGGPDNISGAFTLIVLRTKDADSNGFYSIYQTAIAREDVPNNYEHRVYSRLILRNDSSNVTTYTKWIEISSRLVRDSLNTEVLRALAAEKKNKDAIAVLNGDSNTTGSVKKAIADLIGGAPEAYDTLKEIADYIASDKNAGAALTKAISNETNRAKAAEKTNADAIAANKTAIDNLETTKLNKADYHPYDDTNVLSYIDANKTALASEVTRAKAAEKVNADAIAKNKSAIDILNGDSTVDGSVKKAIKDVVGAAPEALDTLEEIAKQLEGDESTVKALTNTISEETTRAKAAEEANANNISTNATNLSNEITRAKAAESTLQTSVSSNKSAIDILNGTSDVDGSVKKAIKDVVGAAPEALNTLGEIATELTNHENAAAAITTAIATETNRAKAAEKAIADSIAVLNNRIKIVSITSSDYTALATKDANTLYCIPE